MIRFVAALCIGAAMLGSVALCQWSLTRHVQVSLARDVDEQSHTAEAHSTQATTYTIVLTAGFAAGKDPFAVQLNQGAEAPRLTLSHEGETLYATRDDLRRGAMLSVTGLTFRGEQTELHVSATPQPDAAKNPCPLRIQLFQDQVLCADRTVWSPGQGAPLSASVILPLKPRYRSLDRGLGQREEHADE